MKPIPKRHHVVPQMLLKEFANDAGELFAFDRRTPSRGVVREKYAKLFIETHFYSYDLGDAGKDPSPETFLSALESAAAPIFVRITEAARRRQLADLTSSDHDVLRQFAYYQWKRSPEAVTAEMLADFDAEIESGLEEFERLYRPVTPEERALFATPAFRQRLKHNARVGATVSSGSLVLSALAGTGLHITRITHPRKSYIVGSRMVAKLTMPGDTLIGSPNVEFWMPIAFDVALACPSICHSRFSTISMPIGRTARPSRNALPSTPSSRTRGTLTEAERPFADGRPRRPRNTATLASRSRLPRRTGGRS
jgi:hypothetical protein